MNKKSLLSGLTLMVAAGLFAASGDNVIDEVAWMIGDEPIYKSEIEQAYMDLQNERMSIPGDPYCVIPEQIAIDRLFLHRADIDTIEVQESMVQMQVDARMNFHDYQPRQPRKGRAVFPQGIPRYPRILCHQHAQPYACAAGALGLDQGYQGYPRRCAPLLRRPAQR